MKLDQKEAKKISEMYNLGNVKRIKKIDAGFVNHNYDMKTVVGNFIIRFFGQKLDKYKKNKLKLERDVLIYLDRSKFPYKVPVPINNVFGEYISEINGKSFWVYKKIDGGNIGRINNQKLIEIARALAIYHKYIRGFKIDQNVNNIFSLCWIQDRYRELEKVKPKNKIDVLMKDNFYMFNNMLNDFAKKNFKINLIVLHGDIHGGNLLFKKDKANAILDFDTLEIGPRAHDVAYAIKQACCAGGKLDKNKMNLFLGAYEKINKLMTREKEMIIPLILRDNCIVFWWFYAGMKKKLNKKHALLKWTIDLTKNLVKELK